MNHMSATRQCLFLLLVINAGTNFAARATGDLYKVTSITSKSLSVDRTVSENVSFTELVPSNTTSPYQELSTDVNVPPESHTTLDAVVPSETVVFNKFATPPSHYDKYTTVADDPVEPSDHAIPSSEHEEAKDIATKPKYSKPGDWAHPPKEKNIPLDFVPTKLYAQVRGTHSVKRLPQEEAVKNAQTDEEKENASRLREVVKNTKVNTVYTEEGYEDSAYDHAGHIRDADYQEGFARKLDQQLDLKKKSGDSPEIKTKINKKGNRGLTKARFKKFQDYDEDNKDPYEGTAMPTMELQKLSPAQNTLQKINPQLIVESGIKNLEEDIEKESHNAEKNAEKNQFENTKVLEKRPIEGLDSSGSEEEVNENYNKIQRTTKRRPSSLQGISNKVRNTPPSFRAQLKEVNENNRNSYDDNYTSVSNDEETKSNDREVLDSVTLPYYDFLRTDSPGYKINRVSPYLVAPIAEDDSTTPNYEQYFWELSKTKDHKVRTEAPFLDESSDPEPPFNSQIVRNVPGTLDILNNQGVYTYNTDSNVATKSADQAQLLPFKDIVSQSISDQFLNYAWPTAQASRYSQSITNLAREPTLASYASFPNDLGNAAEYNSWQPLTASSLHAIVYPGTLSTVDGEPSGSATENAQLKVSQIKQEIEPPENNSKQSNIGDKQRYKLAMREKPKKFIKSSKNQPQKQEASSDSGKESEKQRKAVRNSHTKNERIKLSNYVRGDNNASPVASLPTQQQSNNYNSRNQLNAKDLTRMRPPLPQAPNKIAYYRTVPGHPLSIEFGQPTVTSESEAQRQPNWQKLLNTGEYRTRDFVKHLDDKPVILTFEQSSFPVTKLMPPSPYSQSDYAKYQFGNDYQSNPTYSASNLMRDANFASSHGLQTVPYENVKRRHRTRRSMGLESTGVKAMDSIANNATSNQNKTDQADKTTVARRTGEAERNSRKKATSGSMRTEFGLDMPFQKKWIFYMNENNRNDVSVKLADQGDRVIVNRERYNTPSNRYKTNEEKERGENVLDSFQYTDTVPMRTRMQVTTRLGRDAFQADNRNVDHEELLNEAPNVANAVIEKELNARFNKNEENLSNESDVKKGEEVEVEVPALPYVEELPEEEEEDSKVLTTTEVTLDFDKYPFYRNSRKSDSAIKYAVDPQQRPRKTSGGMEFYASRNRECSEIEPNLDEVLPEEEEPITDRSLKENLPRLRGLGEKLDCLKAKYFDENPFDNPLFSEKEVEQPTPPTELDPKQFAKRIMVLPEQDDEYVVQMVSRKPEDNYHTLRDSESINTGKVNRWPGSIQLDHKNNPYLEQETNGHYQSVRPLAARNPEQTRIPNVLNKRIPLLNIGQATERRQKLKYPTESFPSITEPTIYSIQHQGSRKSPVIIPNEDSQTYSRKFRQSARQAVRTRQPGTRSKKVQNSNVDMTDLSSSDSTSPYQREVYEDVMGNIRQLANSYQVHEDTASSQTNIPVTATIPFSTVESQTSSPSVNDLHAKHIEFPHVNATVNRSNLSHAIEGLVPPEYMAKYATNFGTSRSLQRGRMAPVKPGGSKIIGLYQTIRIHKRSVENENLTRNLSMRSNETEAGEVDKNKDLIAHETVTSRTHVYDSSEVFTTEHPTETVESTSRNKSSKISSSESNEQSGKKSTQDKDMNGESSRRDRIRYSKPKEELTKVGEFSKNETSRNEDPRRREPKYNPARGRKVQGNRSISTKMTEKETDTALPTNRKNVIKEPDPYDFYENFDILKIKTGGGVNENSKKNMKGSSTRIRGDKQEAPSGYAVHEDIEGDTPAKRIRVRTATRSKISREKTNSEYQTPMYSIIKNTSGKLPSSEEDSNKNDENQETGQMTESNTQRSIESSTDNKQWHSIENSGVKNSENEDLQSRQKSSNQSTTERENSSTEDKSPTDEYTFFKSSSRPFSPAESFEDEKYADLGPRINKPEFYHPRFSISTRNRYRNNNSGDRSDSSEWSHDKDDTKSSESDEAEHYAFPWETKKGNGKHKKSGFQWMDSYEFPWERRARLEKQRNNAKKDRYKKFRDFYDRSDDSSEAEGTHETSSSSHYENSDSWDRSDRPDKIKNRRHSVWQDSESDSESSSTEYQPTMKYSSRYKSKIEGLSSIEKPVASRRNSLQNASKPAKTTFENNTRDERNLETPEDYLTVPEIPSLNTEQQINSSSTTSRNTDFPRRTIVPEDITLAPRRKPERKEIAKLHNSESTTPGSVKNISNVEHELRPKKYSSDTSEFRQQLMNSNTKKNKGSSSSQIQLDEKNNRRRRKPSKTLSAPEPLPETLTENTSKPTYVIRRRQKVNLTVVSAPTTSNPISRSAISTTSAPRSTRRRNPQNLSTTSRPKISEQNQRNRLRNRTTNRTTNISEPDNKTMETKTKAPSKRIRGPSKKQIDETAVKKDFEKLSISDTKENDKSDDANNFDKHEVKKLILPKLEEESATSEPSTDSFNNDKEEMKRLTNLKNLNDSPEGDRNRNGNVDENDHNFKDVLKTESLARSQSENKQTDSIRKSRETKSGGQRKKKAVDEAFNKSHSVREE